jgi:single-strand DNA-binding protein
MSRDVNSINKVILVGRVGQAPETRVLPQRDSKVVRFSVATNERSFNPNTKETRDYTEWHRITVWGKLADFAEKYITQGKQLLVEGKLRTRKWQDKEGNKRSTTEIEAVNIILLGRRDEAGAGEAPEPEARGGGGYGGGGGAPEDEFPEPAEGGGGGTGEDDIPF